MNEERKIPWTNNAIQALLIGGVVLIILYFTVFNNTVKVEKLTRTSYTNTLTELKAAAEAYLDKIEAPKEDVDYKRVYIDEIISNNKEILIHESCSLNKSFITYTKVGKEIQIRTKLVCGEFSDYVLNYVNKSDNTEKPVDKPEEPKPVTPTKPSGTNKIKQYEYYTQTKKSIPYNSTQKVERTEYVNVEKCVHNNATKYTKTKHILSYTRVIRNDDGTIRYLESAPRYTIFDLPSNVVNVKVNSNVPKYGYTYFSLPTYKYNVNSNLQENLLGDMPSVINSSNSYKTTGVDFYGANGLNSKDLTVVNASNGTYKIGIKPSISKLNSTISADRRTLGVSTTIDSRLGEIVYMPVRIEIEYYTIASGLSDKACKSLNDVELNYITRRYLGEEERSYYVTEDVVKYRTETTNSSKKWTSKKGVKGYIYTGKYRYVNK